MLGGDGQRFAQAQRIGFQHRAFALAPFRLVDHRYDRHVGGAQVAGDLLVQRGQPGARIGDEQRRVRAFQRGFGLLAHPAGQAGGVLVLPPGGVDNGEAHPGNLGIAHAPVARHAGLVVHQRQLLADQAIEQRRFADIGPTYDHDCGEGGGIGHRHAARWPLRPRLASAAASPCATWSISLNQARKPARNPLRPST